MKIKAVASICKKSKSIILYDKESARGGVSQWVGDGIGFYPIENIPYVEAENMCTIFEFSEKQRSEFLIRHTDPPQGLCLEDTDSTKKALENTYISIAYSGRILKPLLTSKGLVFIDSKYLSPLAEIWDIMKLYERTMPGGKTIIAVKAGFLLYAVIAPHDIMNDTFVDQIEKLARQCRDAFGKSVAEKVASGEREYRQQSITYGGEQIDPSTGEILEPEETEE